MRCIFQPSNRRVKCKKKHTKLEPKMNCSNIRIFVPVLRVESDLNTKESTTFVQLCDF